MTKPAARNSEEWAKEVLAQNFQLAQENRILLERMKGYIDEIADLKAKPPEPKPSRPSIRT